MGDAPGSTREAAPHSHGQQGLIAAIYARTSTDQNIADEENA